MPLHTTMDLATALRALSRPVIMWHYEENLDLTTSPALWEPDLGLPLTLEHAGDTEGVFTVSFETERSNLLVPELFGNVPLKSYISSETPSITGNVWMADPAIRKKWSPTGVAHGGRSRRAEDLGVTMVIFPEDCFFAADGQTEVGVLYEGSDWWQQPLADDGETALGDPVAVPAAKAHLFESIIFLWRVARDRADIVLQHDEGSRSLSPVGIIPMIHESMPNAHHVFTMGNPADYDIAVGGGES